jgi:hypothetical protein
MAAMAAASINNLGESEIMAAAAWRWRKAASWHVSMAAAA